MILRRSRGDGECFVELDEAVKALTDRVVVFNANYGTCPPAGSIIYNTDLVGIHCDPAKWRGHEIWDFCYRNIALYPADIPVTYVPIGFHPSMQRFKRLPLEKRDIDVVFSGAMNARREKVLTGFRKAGLVVVWNDLIVQRDALLARSRLALNMLFYTDGVYPVVRAAHLVANGTPMLNETSPEMPLWAGGGVGVDQLVDAAVVMLRQPIDEVAVECLEKFRAAPLVLPC